MFIITSIIIEFFYSVYFLFKFFKAPFVSKFKQIINKIKTLYGKNTFKILLQDFFWIIISTIYLIIMRSSWKFSDESAISSKTLFGADQFSSDVASYNARSKGVRNLFFLDKKDTIFLLR